MGCENVGIEKEKQENGLFLGKNKDSIDKKNSFRMTKELLSHPHSASFIS